MVGREKRPCPTCEIDSWFEVYQSWERDTRWSFLRRNVRTVARCDGCEYRILLDA